MRAYHRIDPLMDERKGHYTPAQLGAFVKIQLLAGRQTNRGRFRSVKALTGMLPGAYARHVPFLLEQRDLVERRGGEVYVDGWDEWQEGDITVADRMARLRNRQRHSTVTPTVTGPSPAAIGVGVGVGVSESSSLSGAKPGRATQPSSGRKNGLKPPEDEERITRNLAILNDPDQPDWKRRAAKDDLDSLGVPVAAAS